MRILTLFPKIALRAIFHRHRGISSLLGANILGQLVGLAALPLVTRLYTTNQFGAFAVFAALVNTIVPIAAGRYDAAIPLARNAVDRVNLLAISLGAAIITGLVAGAIAVCAWLFKFHESASALSLSILYIAPLAIILGSWQNAGIFYAVQRRDFAAISRNRATQPLMTAVVQIICGFVIPSYGLFLALVASLSLGSFRLNRRRFKLALRRFRPNNVATLKKTALSYSAYPKNSIIEEISNHSAMFVPWMIVAHYLGIAEAGLFFIATRIVGTPQMIVGHAFAQHFHAHCAEYVENREIDQQSVKLTYSIWYLFALPMLFFCWAAIPASSFILGSEWVRAGELIAIMTPWYVQRIIATSLQPIAYAANKHSIYSKTMFYGAIVRIVLPLCLGIMGNKSIVEWMSALGLIFFTVCIFLLLSVANNSSGILIKVFSKIGLSGLAAYGAGLFLFSGV